MARILVVDDQLAYRKYLSRRLIRDGHEVETAASADEGIKRGTDLFPDLLVVDWMLGADSNGIDLYRVLRTGNPQLKALLITGYPSAEIVQRAREESISLILEKPFSLDDLSDWVRENSPNI